MSFGIDFGSILAALWHQIQCLLVICFFDFVDGIFIDFEPKWLPKSSAMRTPLFNFSYFSTLFRGWCFRRFLGSLWLPFGSLLVHVGRFGYPFDPFQSLA